MSSDAAAKPAATSTAARVLLAEQQEAAVPVIWRQVGSKPQTAANGQPDAGAQLAQMKQQYEQRVREAQAAGVREGEAAGRSRATAEVQVVIERLGRSIDELAQMRGRLRQEAEADTVRLSLAIARRVLGRELAVDPDAMRGIVHSALGKLQSQEICRVKVHASHAALVTACLQMAGTVATAEVVADPGCELGGVIFETTRGNLDASVNSQLQEIERGLTDRIRKR